MAWIIIILSLYFQVWQLWEPLNQAQVPVNIVYLVVTVLNTVMLAFSYKSQRMLYLIQPVVITLTLRSCARLMDFE